MATQTRWYDLIGEYRDFGFRIEYPEASLLALYFKDKKIATLYRNQVTPKILQEGCKNYLVSISRGL